MSMQKYRIKTNEEKATELGIKYQTPCHGIGDCEFEARQAALEMAEWKEQQMIERACSWLFLNADVFGFFKKINLQKMVNEFAKAMKGGEE